MPAAGPGERRHTTVLRDPSHAWRLGATSIINLSRHGIYIYRMELISLSAWLYVRRRRRAVQVRPLADRNRYPRARAGRGAGRRSRVRHRATAGGGHGDAYHYGAGTHVWRLGQGTSPQAHCPHDVGGSCRGCSEGLDKCAARSPSLWCVWVCRRAASHPMAALRLPRPPRREEGAPAPPWRLPAGGPLVPGVGQTGRHARRQRSWTTKAQVAHQSHVSSVPRSHTYQRMYAPHNITQLVVMAHITLYKRVCCDITLGRDSYTRRGGAQELRIRGAQQQRLPVGIGKEEGASYYRLPH